MSSLVSQCLHSSLTLNPTVNVTRCLHLHRRAVNGKLRLAGPALSKTGSYPYGRTLFHSSARTHGARNAPTARPRPKLASPSTISSSSPSPSGARKGKGKPKNPKPDLPWMQRGNQRARKEANKSLSLSHSRSSPSPYLGEQFAFSGERPGFRPGFNADRRTPPPPPIPREDEPPKEEKPIRTETNEEKNTRLGLIKAQKARVRREKDPRRQAELLGRMGVDPGAAFSPAFSPSTGAGAGAVGEGEGMEARELLDPERMKELVRREELRQGRGRGRGGQKERGPIRGGGGVEREYGQDVEGGRNLREGGYGYEPPYRREVEERASRPSVVPSGSFRAGKSTDRAGSSSYPSSRAPTAGQGGYEPPDRQRAIRSSSRDSAGSSSYTPQNRDGAERTPSSYRRAGEGQTYRPNQDRSSTPPPPSPSASPSAYRREDKDLGRGRTRYDSDRARVPAYNPPTANARAVYADADANAFDGNRAARSSTSSFPARRSLSGSGSGSGPSFEFNHTHTPDRHRQHQHTPDYYRQRESNRERASIYPSRRSTHEAHDQDREYDAPEGHLLPDEALAQGQSEFFHSAHVITTSLPLGAPSHSHHSNSNTKANDSDPNYIPTTFTSPPLLPGFLSALRELFGDGVRPTVIQGLSLRWVVGALGCGGRDVEGVGENVEGAEWKGGKKVEKKGEREEGRDGKDGKEVEGNTVLSEAEQVLQEAAEGAVETAAPVPAPAQVTVPALAQPQVQPQGSWRQFLLASETGSGKSIAYLLPVLQHLKRTESSSSLSHTRTQTPAYPPRPRALILAPTHELARQLAGFAKELVRFPDTRLRVMCASRGNSGIKGGDKEDKGKKAVLDGMERVVYDTDVDIDLGSVVRKGEDGDGVGVEGNEGGEGKDGKMAGTNHVDVLVGTPMKLLEMVRGRGWDRVEPSLSRGRGRAAEEVEPANEENQDQDQDADGEEGSRKPKLRRGRDKMPHFGHWKTRAELRLEDVECVVVDEADVLFDPDFQETTRALLADISAARGHPIPASPHTPSSTPPPTPITYPFHLLLTSATIPTSLNTYLTTTHPSLIRLASPRLHKLPKTLQTEYAAWSGGNKFADVLRRVKEVWAEDAASVGFEEDGRRRGGGQGHGEGKELSKVVVFCNKSAKVDLLSAYMREQGVENVPLTSTSVHRERFTNRHLDGFLRVRAGRPSSLPPSASSSHPSPSSSYSSSPSSCHPSLPSPPKPTPKVLITTSLLSRGLDFSPSIRHVFIVDEPRNMVDFLHRAGRAGRAGERGRVVVFGKMRGRGSRRGREVRGRVGRLV